MNRTQKITVVVSALVVTGLVAVAVPAVTAVASELSGWAVFNQPAAVPIATPTAEAEPKADEADNPAGIPDGYMHVGYGTYIPAGGFAGCESSAYIFLGSATDAPVHAELTGADLVDMGPREFAVGEVGLDDQGRPETYTVARGDVLSSIGDRFCIYNGQALGLLNGYSHGAAIQPGDVIVLNADLVTDWVNPYTDE